MSSNESGGVLQETDSVDVLVAALLYIAKAKGRQLSQSALCAGMSLEEGRLSLGDVAQAAKKLGFNAELLKRPLEDISNLVLPAILILNNNQIAVLCSIDSAQAQLYFPETKEEKTEPCSSLQSNYSGRAIYLKYEETESSRREVEEESLAWFWRVLAGSWRIYRDVLLASVLINIFVLANPLFVMNVYDRVVPNSAIATLWALALGIIVLYAFDFTLKLLRHYFLELAGKKSDIVLSNFILQKVLFARCEYQPRSVGVFASHMREFETIRQFMTSSMLTVCIDLPFVILFVLLMFYIGGSLVWVPLVFVPITLVYSLLVHRLIQSNMQKSFDAAADKNAVLIEGISQLLSVKVNNTEHRMLAKWNATVSRLAKWGVHIRLLSFSSTALAALCQQLAAVFVVIAGVYAISEQELTQGALIACVLLSSRILVPFSQIATLLSQFYQSRLALNTINTLVKTPQEMGEHNSVRSCGSMSDVLTGAIDFKSISFTFPDEVSPALSNITLSISPGERVAIIGKVGSGKSTLLKLLMGLYEPERGSLRFDGKDISMMALADVRESMAYVPQEIALLSGTIRDNIVLSRHVNGKDLVSAADISGISEWLNLHERGFERDVGEYGRVLSGGQKQGVIIARALAVPKQIVLMDEPSSGLDNSAEKKLIEGLASVTAGKTFMLATHKMPMLKLVDRIIVLDRGLVLADGPKDKVLDALKGGQIHAYS